MRRLKYETELLQIIILDPEDAENPIVQQEQYQTLTMPNLEKTEAVEFLKRILYLERKTEFVRGIDLENHKVVQIWEQMGFPDKKAFQIANQLSKKRQLIDIANEMESRRQMEALGANRSQVNIETTLASSTVIGQMKRAGEPLLNDLIFFLTLCPHGLGLTEVGIVLKRLLATYKDIDEFE